MTSVNRPAVQPALALVRERGHTVAGLARRLRVERLHLSRVLNGRVTPSHEVRVGLSLLLDRPVTTLFTPDALLSSYHGGAARPTCTTPSD